LEENIKKTKELMEAVLGEVFGELEAKHPLKDFGELVKSLDGKRIPTKSSKRQTENGTYPYYGASGIIDYVDDFIFDGENLLISEDGANLVVRKYPIAFLATGKYWVNNHAHVVCAKPQITSNKFLAWYFAFKDISDFITGAAQPKLSQKKLNVIPFAIPSSLETQKKILTSLENLKDGQDSLQKHQTLKLQSLLSLKSSLLDQAFRGEL
jgi:type I restriction enzyme, S subunit